MVSRHLTLFTLATSVLPALASSLYPPLAYSHGLVARQAENCADLGYQDCGTFCIPQDYTCCPDQLGGCPTDGFVCTLGNNNEYGCCETGETCEGPGGVDTISSAVPGTVTISVSVTGSVTTEVGLVTATPDSTISRGFDSDITSSAAIISSSLGELPTISSKPTTTKATSVPTRTTISSTSTPSTTDAPGEAVGGKDAGSALQAAVVAIAGIMIML